MATAHRPEVKRHISMKDVADLLIDKMRKEKDSQAHQLFRNHFETHKHKDSIPGIDAPGSTGVIFVTERASANGYKGNEDPEWANFGQGAPETGPLPGGTPRPSSIDLSQWGDEIHEYAPTAGVKEFREAIADYYNREFRQHSDKKYTFQNICVVPGGRAGLSRIASVIGDCYLDSDLLAVFHRLIPVSSALAERDGYHLDVDHLREQIITTGLSAVLLSNPRNPTGQALIGDELKQLVGLSRETETTIILDEFYSWYQYDEEFRGKASSAAAYVDDPKTDAIVLIDGLTKNWRLPGWRCCWVVGPEALISAISQSGSFLDGGAAHPLQVAAIPLLRPEVVQQDRLALQNAFKEKRDYVLKRLDDMGLHLKHPPHATFYIWLDLSSLPEPLNSGIVFFEEVLKEKVIVVPGLAFDVNPMHRRSLTNSPCAHFVRMSFGPKMEVLKRGLDGIQRLIERVKREGTDNLDKDLAPAPEPGSHQAEHGKQAI